MVVMLSTAMKKTDSTNCVVLETNENQQPFVDGPNQRKITCLNLIFQTLVTASRTMSLLILELPATRSKNTMGTSLIPETFLGRAIGKLDLKGIAGALHAREVN